MSINLWQLKTRAGSHVPNQWGPRMQGRPFTFRPKFPRVGGSDKIRAAASSTAAPAAASIAATTRAAASIQSVFVLDVHLDFLALSDLLGKKKIFFKIVS